MTLNKNYEVHELKTFYYRFANYSYIIIDKMTKFALIVDPAWELEKVNNMLYQLGANLKAIVLTHSHFDHVNLVKPLIKLYNPSVYMSAVEIDCYGFKCKNLNRLNDSDEIKIGETKILCIHTPGHTAGGMCYLLQDSVFTGDTVFTEGCGMCDCRESAEKMYDSIRRLKSIVPVNAAVYPGHSYGRVPGQTLEKVMKINIYFHFEDKEKFVNFRMRKNQKGLFNFK